jgi:predicted metal-dependent HD superfamily phosphohydrolase
LTTGHGTEGLKARWRTHVQTLGNFSAPLVGTLFDSLCRSYSEPHRHYHTTAHLTWLFDCLEKHADEIGDPTRLAFAVWYHDSIYDPRRRDNEARSAERAMKELDALGATPALRSHVVQLILATRNHAEGGRDYDDDIFLDADIAILASPAAEYDSYARQIRAEYAHLDDAAWAKGRTDFLKATAARERIFRSGIFEGEYAAAARENMARELAALAGST